MRVWRYILLFCLLIPTGAKSDGKPFDKVKFTFSERFRMVGWDNAIDLNKNGDMNQHFTRHRTSAGLEWEPNHSLIFHLKLTHEFRHYFTPSTATFHWNEVFFDQLYIRYSSQEFLRGSITFGRQNIFLGEGFVIWDGHPVDGSRSAYFNAIRYDLDLNAKHKITSFIAYQPKEDELLPVINGKDIDPVFQGDHSYQLIEQSEKAVAMYYQGRLKESEIDLYYIFKSIADDGIQLVPKSDIHTFGSRFRLHFNPQFSFTVEGAYQTGNIGEETRTAYSGHAYLTHFYKESKFELPNDISIGAFLLSGDRTSTDKYEAWEPLFARWPKWSESYIYTSLKENQGRIAYWSNILAPNIQGRYQLDNKLSVKLSYFKLLAMEQTLQTEFLSGNGKVRGDLITAQLNFKINKHLTGHLLYEIFYPGNFYFDLADPYHWARIELLYVL